MKLFLFWNTEFRGSCQKVVDVFHALESHRARVNFLDHAILEAVDQSKNIIILSCNNVTFFLQSHIQINKFCINVATLLAKHSSILERFVQSVHVSGCSDVFTSDVGNPRQHFVGMLLIVFAVDLQGQTNSKKLHEQM